MTTLAADDMQNNEQTTSTYSSDRSFREITPNAGPRVTNGVDVFVTADFLYWTARQDGLAYVRSGIDDYNAVLSQTNASSGKTYFPENKFSPAFKVGVGLNLAHDGWDVYLDYTWFHTSLNSAVATTSVASEGYVPLWDVASIGSTLLHDYFLHLYRYVNVGAASSFWRFHFNNFDLELGRNFYVSQYLTLRPHLGLKGAWYRQNYNVSYGDFLDMTVVDDVLSTTLKNRQHFWGVGIRTGLDTSWYFDKNWSMFGNLAVSPLWGRFDVTRKDYTTTTAGTTTLGINTNDSFHTIKFVGEFQLGLRYDYWFSDDDYHFGIEAAWEEQLWFNHNQLFVTTQPWGSHGDLIMQGLTIDVRFDF